MDKQVLQALAKWPNVPHCYGWLGLDARGAWRMRDMHAQQQGVLGDKIANPTLRAFINRNYQCDAEGRYFFQNGPQRVYVDLQSTPYIARFDPQSGWVLHTGHVLNKCDAVWMTEHGNVVLISDDLVAQIDDRDMLAAFACMYLHGQLISDDQLLAWSLQPQAGLTFLFHQQVVPVRYAELNSLAQTYLFVSHPEAPR